MSYAYNVIVGAQQDDGKVIESSIKCLGIFLTQREAVAVAKQAPAVCDGITWVEVYSSNGNKLCLSLRKQVHKWVDLTKQIA